MATFDEIRNEYSEFWPTTRAPSIAEVVSSYWQVFQGPAVPMSADELTGIERRLVEAEEILSGNLAASSSAVEHDPFMWAYEIVQATVDRGDQAAVSLVLEQLALTASDERRVGLLGAGPLDDLVHERMPEIFSLLKELGASNPTIRAALAEIWIDNEIDGFVASWLLELRSPET